MQIEPCHQLGWSSKALFLSNLALDTIMLHWDKKSKHIKIEKHRTYSLATLSDQDSLEHLGLFDYTVLWLSRKPVGQDWCPYLVHASSVYSLPGHWPQRNRSRVCMPIDRWHPSQLVDPRLGTLPMVQVEQGRLWWQGDLVVVEQLKKFKFYFQGCITRIYPFPLQMFV